MPALRNERTGMFKWVDGTAVTPKTHVWEYEGDLNVNVKLFDVIIPKHRGGLVAPGSVPEFLKGEDQPVEIAFTGMIRVLTSASADTSPLSIAPWDAVKETGYFSSDWVSTVSGSPKKCVHIHISVDGGTTWEVYQDCFVADGSWATKMDGDQVSFKMICPHNKPGTPV